MKIFLRAKNKIIFVLGTTSKFGTCREGPSLKMVLEGKITPWALKLGTEGSGLLTCVLYILDSPRQHPYIEYEQYRTEARSLNILRVR